MKFTHTEHIVVEDDGKDFINVKIDHIEIFDFLDDYFTEDCNFQDCLYQNIKDNKGKNFEIILVPRKYTFDSVCKALLKVDKVEIEKMHAIKVDTIDNC